MRKARKIARSEAGLTGHEKKDNRGQKMYVRYAPDDEGETRCVNETNGHALAFWSADKAF